MPLEVPPNYVSKDVEDRRDGKSPTLVERLSNRVRKLVVSVQDEYSDSLKGQPSLNYDPTNDASRLDDAAAQRIRTKVSQKLGSQ